MTHRFRGIQHTTVINYYNAYNIAIVSNEMMKLTQENLSLTGLFLALISHRCQMFVMTEAMHCISLNSGVLILLVVFYIR